MCDEYDDERMRAFWRALAARDELAKRDLGAEDTPEPETPVLELGPVDEPKRTKPRSLAH